MVHRKLLAPRLLVTASALALLLACNPEREEPPPKGADEAGVQDASALVDATGADSTADATSVEADARAVGMDAQSGDSSVGVGDGGAAAPGSLAPAMVPAVDLLFVIDNSGSMASEQVRLSAELDRMIRMLTLGDRTPDAAPEPNRSNKSRYFNPVKDLHVGVVSTNVGGIDQPGGPQVAVLSCAGAGDAGRLQSDTKIAADGVIAARSNEFEGFASGEIVLPPDPACALPPGPAYATFVPGSAGNAETAQRLRCSTRLGVRGCPFEQPFEAMRRALGTPSEGGASAVALEVQARNAGFLREDAVLAVVFVSDEDDCSITQAGKPLFDTTPRGAAELKYGEKINLRCALFGEAEKLLLPVDGYAQFLESLKPGHPERLHITSIVGIPPAHASADPDALLALPELQFRERQDGFGLLEPSCVRPDPARPGFGDRADPPRRFLELTKRLGARASVYSICADGYGPALAALIDRFAPLVAP